MDGKLGIKVELGIRSGRGKQMETGQEMEDMSHLYSGLGVWHGPPTNPAIPKGKVLF